MAGAFVAPAHSLAASNALPGNSALDQYLETVPDGAGGDAQRNGGGDGKSSLPPKVKKRLLAEGVTGADLARFTEATGPSRTKPKQTGVRDRAAGDSTIQAEPGDSVIKSVARAMTGGGGDGGMGPILPVLIVGTALFGAVAALRRRRSTS